MAAYLGPCVNLKWCLGTIGWLWLPCIGVKRSGQAMKGWPMPFIFSLECCERKEGPLGSQIRPQAFNRLRTPFCAPILSPPYYYHVRYHYPHEKKTAQNGLNFGCL